MAGNNILVVDDSAVDRQIATDALISSGYRVSQVADGEECLKAVHAKRPDLIVLDVILPKQNGFQICRALKQDPTTKDIPIILLSSKNQPSDLFWGKKQGADLYLTKPFEDGELVKGVASLV